MELITDTYFKKHLYFESHPNSREYKLDRCMKVLGMIAQLRDRNRRIELFNEQIYGRTDNGHLLASESDCNEYILNTKKIQRLKGYYNYCLSKLESYPFQNVK